MEVTRTPLSICHRGYRASWADCTRGGPGALPGRRRWAVPGVAMLLRRREPPGGRLGESLHTRAHVPLPPGPDLAHSRPGAGAGGLRAVRVLPGAEAPPPASPPKPEKDK